MDAAPLLEECHARHPEDRDIAENLADAWLGLGRWGDARALLVGLLADPPGHQDAGILQKLQNAAYARGDSEYLRWQEVLATIDPARTVAGQLPTPLAEAPREPMYARFKKGWFGRGKLFVSAEYAELSPEEQRAHMAAAMIAASSDSRQKLGALEASEPALAVRVMRLLGIERLTSSQVEDAAHLKAGEEHFREQRFEDAQREYQKAVDLDPDDALALLSLGDATYNLGLYDLAQAYFEESLAITPSPQALASSATRSCMPMARWRGRAVATRRRSASTRPTAARRSP